MTSTWDAAFGFVLVSEGGYVNDPHDHGGETNLGVTRKAWSAYLGRAVADGEMRALRAEQVKPFYKALYWDAVHGDGLPAGLDYAVFDLAVNAGPARAAKLLQAAVGAPVDGVVGPATLAAAAADPRAALLALSAARRRFYRGLVAHDAAQARFLRGWLRRVAVVQKRAIALVG